MTTMMMIATILQVVDVATNIGDQNHCRTDSVEDQCTSFQDRTTFECYGQEHDPYAKQDNG